MKKSVSFLFSLTLVLLLISCRQPDGDSTPTISGSNSNRDMVYVQGGSFMMGRTSGEVMKSRFTA